MDDSSMQRDMIFTAVVIGVSICACAFQVLRTLSRGALDATAVLRLACSMLGLGIMAYVGYTIFSLWA